MAFFGRVSFLNTGVSVHKLNMEERGIVVVILAIWLERSFMMIAKASGWVGAVVYFDAIAAFAAMLRALVCHQSSREHPTSDALMAVASGFSAEEVATVSREALHAPASEIMLQSLHLRRLLSDALSNTWAATQGVQGEWQLREDAPRLANLWRILLLE